MPKPIWIFSLSLLCGAAATLFVGATFFIVESASSEGVKVSDITTLVAGVVGAVIGGAISWVQSRQTSKQTLQRDKEARMSIVENNALSTLLKVQRIANSYHTHKMYFWSQLREANSNETIVPQLWQIMKSQVAGSETGINFSAEELVPLQLAGKTDLINECGLLSERLQVVERGMIEYTRLRRELETLLIDHSRRQPDGTILTKVPAELSEKASIMSDNLEQFIRQLYADITSDDTKAKALCSSVSEAFVAHFDNGLKFTMKFVDEDDKSLNTGNVGVRAVRRRLHRDRSGNLFFLSQYVYVCPPL